MSEKKEISIEESMATDESFVKFLRGPGSIITEIKDNEWPAYKRAGKAAGTFSEEESEEIGDYNEMPLQTSETARERGRFHAVKRKAKTKNISQFRELPASFNMRARNAAKKRKRVVLK